MSPITSNPAETQRTKRVSHLKRVEPRAEFREDGIYLLWSTGEVAGPFRTMENAEAFLDYLENLQRELREKGELLDESA